MAYAALLSLAQTTEKTIQNQYKYPISQNRRQQLRSIDESFMLLKVFLDESPEEGNKLAGRIRDAAREAEHILESFMLDEARSSWWAEFKFKLQMRRVRLETDSITKEVMFLKNNSATSRDAEPLAIGGSSVATSSSRLAPTAKINDVVGLHQDLDEIKHKLCGESRDLEVIPIVGMGGIGKTTLAKYAYDDPLTVHHFDIRAWVTVSQSYSADALFTGLLASMEEQRSERSNEYSPRDKVFRILKGRRYLIVIDDIWSCQAWDDLKRMLPKDRNGSRIILTTRLSDVATYAGGLCPPHEIRLMDDNQSWNLLKEKVFAHQDCPLELESIGKEIATSCKGLPLAIVVVAGLLSTAGNNPNSWRQIADKVNSVGREAQLEKILSLSYTHLPHYLRPCFLYMGIFPEDYEIRVAELIKLWAAEGFLRSSQRLEDEAEECLEDLVRRNLVLITKRKCDGRIKSCSVHDLMRDLCITKAAEEKFLVNFCSGNVTKIRKNQRRLSITPSLPHLSKMKIYGVHTVLCFQGGISVARDLLERFRLLRVLDTGSALVRLLPDELFDLFHLVYLAIYYLGSIPAAISKLQNLQTLNLCARKFWRLFEFQPVLLPQEIWSLSRLRHLVYYGWFPDPTTCSLENLQTLSMAPMPFGVCSDKIMSMSPNLVKLEMDCSGGLPNESFLESLGHLRQLKNLKIRSSFSNEFCGFSFPKTLTKLTLSCVPLPWENMTIVGSLSNLRVLKLKQGACRGTTWITAEEEFPQLEYLLIEKSGLEQWITESSSHFPRLKWLVLVEMWQLNEIPLEFGEISTLEVIEVKGRAKRSMMESAQRILEEQQEYGNDAFQFRYMALERETEDSAMMFLLNNLQELLVHNSHLITDVRSEIENLERDLRLLKESVKNPQMNALTRERVQQIRAVVYEVEDVIDAFVTRALYKKNKGESFLSFLKFWEPSIDLHAIGKKVKDVKLKVDAGVDFSTLSVDDEDASEKLEVRLPRQKDVVGFEDVTEDLIGRLTKETEYLDVVSVIGMFGLGKTTLAWKIFNDPQILYHFPIRIWLPISQAFSLKDIYLTILKQFNVDTDEIRETQNYELAKVVAAKLETSSFLIVMDDVWSPADWDELRDALPDNKNGKVLITSRIEEVGKYASFPRPPHQLRFFDHDESWELLWLEVLGTVDCPSELEEVGKLIAAGCGGLPLAIVVIGGILATKYWASNMSAWEEVSKQVIKYLNDDPGNRVNEYISLSYDNLPSHLRPCFLYLGMFPEDYEIPSSQLIQMWIGEGFIQQNNDPSSLEDIAEKYLDDLINNNLVMVDKFKPDGKIKTCRIHNILGDFCRTVAGNENENFFQEIKYEDGNFVPRVSDLYRYRRLSIHSNCLRFIRSKPAGHRTRSFVCFSKDEFMLPQENISDMLTAFMLVRVLHVKPIKFPKINSDMFRLVHARYIALSLDLPTLPEKFSELRNIQTLIVDTRSRTLDVEANIWKMSQLRHFKTNASAILPQPTEDSKYGAELQTLGTISVESCTTELFDRACNLKKLGIRGRLALLLEGSMGSFDSLGKMEYLEKLKLINDVYPEALSEGQLSGLPQYYKFPIRLRSLTLQATFLSWNHMSNLGLLENLEVLKLKHNAFSGQIWNAVDGGFQKLKFLHVEHHADLAIWNAASHHFPRLRGLVLKNCEKLREIPIGLADISSFQILELYVSASAAASAEKIQMLKKGKQAAEFKLSIFSPIMDRY